MIVPAKTHVLISTEQVECVEPTKKAIPTDDQMGEFIDDVNKGLPGLAIGIGEIGCIYSGMVPAGGTGQSTFANRPWIVDHANCDGANGLLSAAAVQFTTARRVSLKLITAFSDSPAAAKQEQMP